MVFFVLFFHDLFQDLNFALKTFQIVQRTLSCKQRFYSDGTILPKEEQPTEQQKQECQKTRECVVASLSTFARKIILWTFIQAC